MFKGKIQVVNGNDDIEIISGAIQKLLLEPPEEVSDEEKKDEQELCVICMSNVADYLVLPCGHQCGCESCLTVLRNNKADCPICRAKISNLVKVFRSGIVE